MNDKVRIPVVWESPEEWEIETKAFHAAGRSDVPPDVQELIKELWFQYCMAARPEGRTERLVQGVGR